MKNEELIKALNKCGLRCLEDYLYGCIGCPLYGDNRCDARIKCLAADALEENENRIEELESQMPKRGEWIDDEFTCKGRCSVCGEEWSWFDNCMETFKYCPNCGAKMDATDINVLNKIDGEEKNDEE